MLQPHKWNWPPAVQSLTKWSHVAPTRRAQSLVGQLTPITRQQILQEINRSCGLPDNLSDKARI